MTTANPAPPPPYSYRPWRWEWLGWAIAAAALVYGLPIYLRMPPWCDLTLYDMAARTIMTGGVHYRDVFDTNLPGFVWLLILVRRTLGPSTEAVRIADFAIVTICVLILVRIAKRAGANRLAIAWLTAGVALYYPFTTEFNHAQRDVWMLLPVLVAVALRLKRTQGPSFWRSLREGAIWGTAVWIKPHVVIPAAALWLLTARRITSDGRWRSTLRDLAGNLLGGLVVGAVGVCWLVATNTWPYFVEVFTKWNTHYTEFIFSEMGWRALSHLFHFVPWMFLQPLAVFLAVCDLATIHWGGQDRPPPRWLGRVPRWLFSPASDPRTQYVRAILGGLFVAWVFQSFVFQRQFPYVHVSETLISLAYLAAHRWAVVPACVGYLIVTSVAFTAAEQNPRVYQTFDRIEQAVPWLWRYFPMWNFIPRHPLADPTKRNLWVSCWESLDGPAHDRRQDRLAHLNGAYPSIGVEETNETARWLRERGATAETVLCWHSSPHAVYLSLPGRPAFRFMHVDTALIRDATYQMLREELLRDAIPKSKYVVTDLHRLFAEAPEAAWRKIGTARDDLLPDPLPAFAKQSFPYNQPAVFRSGGGRGRYVVHELTKPISAVEYDGDRFRLWKSEQP